MREPPRALARAYRVGWKEGGTGEEEEEAEGRGGGIERLREVSSPSGPAERCLLYHLYRPDLSGATDQLAARLRRALAPPRSPCVRARLHKMPPLVVVVLSVMAYQFRFFPALFLSRR